MVRDLERRREKLLKAGRVSKLFRVSLGARQSMGVLVYTALNEIGFLKMFITSIRIFMAQQIRSTLLQGRKIYY